jgi:hypothetical protein
MLVVSGFFEKETFIPDNPVSLPQRKHVVLSIEEKEDKEITFKELAVKAKVLRERVKSEWGNFDVTALIDEGRNR